MENLYYLEKVKDFYNQYLKRKKDSNLIREDLE